ncbi:MAG: membrane protein insertase YidC [Oligoflexales bacterium]|nr:membrane protein insertase YidC [Oligoflexales bacterium]
MNTEINKSTILAIVAAIAVMSGYNYYLQYKYPDYYKSLNEKPKAELAPEANQTTQSGAADTALQAPATNSTNGEQLAPKATDSSAVNSAPVETINWLNAKELTFDTLNAKYIFNQKTSSIDSIVLKDYRENMQSKKTKDLLPFPVHISATSGSQATAPSNAAQVLYHAERSDHSLKIWHFEGAFKITKDISFEDQGYGGRIDVTYENVGKEPSDLNALIGLNSLYQYQEGSGGFIPGISYEHTRFVSKLESELNFLDINTECKENAAPSSVSNQKIQIIGVDYHYFLAALLPFSDNLSYSVQMRHQEALNVCKMDITLSQGQGMIAPGEKATLSFKTYVGPKALNILKKHDKNLEATLDLGIFDFIAQPMLIALVWINGIVGNYGIAIILITILLKILFYPLQKQATVSMHRMKELQPQMTALREKFKEDPRRQQQELMKFMSVNKVNPMKGCLPILPQIPVWFAFFRMLSTAIELRHAPFFGWIADLSSKDPYYVTPILLGIVYYIQQKVTPTSMNLDKTQEKIMQFIPVFFAVLMITMPSGLVIYMLANAVMTIFQTKWLNRKLTTISSV